MGLLFHDKSPIRRDCDSGSGLPITILGDRAFSPPLCGEYHSATPPPTTRQVTAALASGNYPLCTAVPIQYSLVRG